MSRLSRSTHHSHHSLPHHSLPPQISLSTRHSHHSIPPLSLSLATVNYLSLSTDSTSTLSLSLPEICLPNPKILARRRSWGLSPSSLRVDVASREVVPTAVPACAPRRWSPLFVAALETKVVCLGPLPLVAVQPPPPFAALRRCRGMLFDRRCLDPLPPLAVQPSQSFATLRRVCLGRLPPLAVQPPPPFDDIFQKYLDWEVLPLMLEKEREPLLRDTLQRWSNHKKMVFWKIVIGLHDKHLGYVTKYFKNNILFREIFLGKAFQVAGKSVCIIFMSVILSFQALDGAFNVFCNENVGNISSAKMLAAYCHDILKRGREELVIETVEKTLKKASISNKDGNMKAVLTLAENMQINFEEYLNLNPQIQSKQYLSFVDFLAYGLKLIIGFSSCCHRTVHLSCHRSYSVGFLQDTINLSEFLTYIALVGILNSIQQSKAIKKGNQVREEGYAVEGYRISSKGDVRS
ncbi:hypothetical protein Scep_029730 [Stephania cephalantha]|uniref:Uncharacterized protein n=1 Tax=Stephania cephalantha TaxID=152367 RepID=A0AAP0E5X8_9MAGN